MKDLISHTTKSRLAAVINAAGDVIHIDNAETTLKVSRTKAAKLLAL